MYHGLRGGFRGTALVKWILRNCWEPDVPSKPPGLRKHRGAFWERHVYGVLAEIESDGGNVTTDEAAENIKITVFLGQWVVPGGVCPLKLTVPLFPH
jgi:hypothetical protein